MSYLLLVSALVAFAIAVRSWQRHRPGASGVCLVIGVILVGAFWATNGTVENSGDPQSNAPTESSSSST